MMKKENLKKKKKDGLVDHMKVILTICDSLRKSRALGQKRGKMSDSLLLKGLFISIYCTFSLNCLRLQQTKKYTRAIFLQGERV